MADFKEVYQYVTEFGLKFDVQKSGKNKGKIAVKHAASGSNGEETLRCLLRQKECESEYDTFITYVREILTPKPKPAQKQSSSTGGDSDLRGMCLDHPDIDERRKYTTSDLYMLSRIRIVKGKQGEAGVMVVQTGEEGSDLGYKFSVAGVSRSGDVLAKNIREALASAPATDGWKKAKLDYALKDKEQEIRERLYAEIRERGEVLDADVFESNIQRRLEEERPSVEAEISEYTLLDQLNDLVTRTLEQLSDEVRGGTSAKEAFIKQLTKPNFPLMFLKSPRFSEWYKSVTTKGDDGNEYTMTYAEKYKFKGDFVDLLADNLSYLWGENRIRMPMPKIFTNDRHTPCFHFFDLEAAKEVRGEHPAWDEFTSRFSPDEADVFRAFVWSIFDAENRGRQCLYIYDRGYSGKGVVFDAIAHYIGSDLHAALSKDSAINQFAYSKVWDKRLVTVGDNKNANFIRSQFAHSLLGGDWIDVECKGQDSFSAKPQCRVMVGSNKALSIDAKARNETSRVLPIHPDDSEDALVKRDLVVLDEDGNPRHNDLGDPILLGDPEWGEKLKAQFPAFLASCWTAYQKWCPRRCEIIMPKETAERIASFDDDRSDLFEELFEKHFTVTNNPSDFIPCNEMKRAVSTAIKSDDVYRDEGLGYEEWKEFLRRRHDLEAVQSRAQNRKRGYMGIRLKSSTDNESSLI